MAKTKRTVISDLGTFTRTTARTYQYLVVVKGRKADVLEAYRRETLRSKTRELAKYRQELATGIRTDWRPAGTVGGDWDRKMTALFIEDGSYVKWIAQLETALASVELNTPITEDEAGDYVVAGWCGRLDLAMKLFDQQNTFRHAAIINVETGKVAASR